jgi:hypothetical protein
MMVLHAAAALAVATSPTNRKSRSISIWQGGDESQLRLFPRGFRPSGCASLCKAVGAIIMGDEILCPNTVVDKSILLTSTRILG